VLESTGERVFFQPDARPPIPRFVHRPFVERLGGCYTLLERYDDAVVLFRLNVERYPERAETWLQLAEALVLTHRIEDALAAAREAVAREPDNERAARLVRQLSGGAPVEDLGHGHRH
jgi:tetratricopeptide (TPR) repeat protein